MQIKPETFKSTLPIQIRFGDIDAMGHINNNIYFSYFDLGKTAYLEAIKPTAMYWVDKLMVVAHIEIDFYSPIYYKEKVAVDTKVTKLGNKSGVFLQQLRNVDNGEIKCRCTTVFVTYNPDMQTSAPIPEIWKETISKYEGLEL